MIRKHPAVQQIVDHHALVFYIKTKIADMLYRRYEKEGVTHDERFVEFELDQSYRWFSTVIASWFLWKVDGNGHFDLCKKHLYVTKDGEPDRNSLKSLNACLGHWEITYNAALEADRENGNDNAINDVLQQIDVALPLYQHNINFLRPLT